MEIYSPERKKSIYFKSPRINRERILIFPTNNWNEYTDAEIIQLKKSKNAHGMIVNPDQKGIQVGIETLEKIRKLQAKNTLIFIAIIVYVDQH
ncbi:hypothetical protein ES703_34700 [subsurface metagenome]